MKDNHKFYSSLYELNPTNPTQIIVQISTDNNANSSQIECIALILNSQLQLDDASQDVIHRQNPKSKNQAILQNKSGNAVFIDCDQLDESQTVHIVALFEPSFKGNLKAIFRAKNGVLLKELTIEGLTTLSKSFKGYALHHQKQWQIHSIGEFSTQNLSQLVESYQYADELPADDFDFDSEFGESQKEDDYFANEFEVVEAEFEEVKPSNGIQKRQSTALINKPTTALKTVSTALVPTQTNNYKGIAPRKNLSLELPKMLYAREVYIADLKIDSPVKAYQHSNFSIKKIAVVDNRFAIIVLNDYQNLVFSQVFDLSKGKTLSHEELENDDQLFLQVAKAEKQAKDENNQQDDYYAECFTLDKKYKAFWNNSTNLDVPICGFILEVNTGLKTAILNSMNTEIYGLGFSENKEYLVGIVYDQYDSSINSFNLILWELEER